MLITVLVQVLQKAMDRKQDQQRLKRSEEEAQHSTGAIYQVCCTGDGCKKAVNYAERFHADDRVFCSTECLRKWRQQKLVDGQRKLIEENAKKPAHWNSADCGGGPAAF